MGHSEPRRPDHFNWHRWKIPRVHKKCIWKLKCTSIRDKIFLEWETFFPLLNRFVPPFVLGLFFWEWLPVGLKKRVLLFDTDPVSCNSLKGSLQLSRVLLRINRFPSSTLSRRVVNFPCGREKTCFSIRLQSLSPSECHIAKRSQWASLCVVFPKLRYLLSEANPPLVYTSRYLSLRAYI